jgi:HEPN domain-containing protein
MSGLTSPPAPGSPADWLEQAAGDLHIAQRLRDDLDALPNLLAFHAQQAAEKAIKAALLHRAIPFPLTHNLQILVLAWQQSGQPWPPDLADTGMLTPFAVQTRYPGFAHQVSRTDLRQAIELAERVVAWAQAIIQLPPTTSPQPPSFRGSS